MPVKHSIKIIDDSNIEVTLSTGATYLLQEPQGNHLKGLSIDFIRAKVADHIQPLYARICAPVLTKKQFDGLNLSDISLLNAALDFFYADPIGRTEIKALYAEAFADATAGDSAPPPSPSLPAAAPASSTSENITAT